jgi:3-hydroxyacyl-CoA dehydrogenase
VKERIAVIGSGLIGRSWACVFAAGGCDVALYDETAGTTQAARAMVTEDLQMMENHGLVNDAESAASRVRAAATLVEALEGATYVQENAPERLEVKRAIFEELDRFSQRDVILASSTSTIVASSFTETLSGRHRCLVAHPVNPPHLIPLVELVPAPWTSAETVARAKALYKSVGQVAVVVKREIEGFILNRLQAVLLSEAFRLVGDGYVTPQDLDKTLKDGLGLRWSFMGPFETIELNAPSGIRDYCRRYGASLSRLSNADPGLYEGENLKRVLARWRPLNAAAIAARMRWRDHRLAALKAHKREQSG